MQIAVPSESLPSERRVALIPDAAKKLVRAGLDVHIESGAGLRSAIPAYSLTGPEMGRPPGRSPRQLCRGGLRRQQQRPDGDDSKEREGRKRKAAAEPAVEAETEAETEAEAEAAAISAARI